MRNGRRRPGLPTKPFYRADEVSPKQDSALIRLDQTTRFGHVGHYHQPDLSAVLQEFSGSRA